MKQPFHKLALTKQSEAICVDMDLAKNKGLHSLIGFETSDIPPTRAFYEANSGEVSVMNTSEGSRHNYLMKSILLAKGLPSVRDFMKG